MHGDLKSTLPQVAFYYVAATRSLGRVALNMRIRGGGLTIRSSGPLRCRAVLSCGTRQRPLSSGVRPNRTIRLR